MKTMRVIYIGPYDSVDVPALDMVVENGVPVEVDEEAGNRLLEQPSNWKPAPTTTTKKAPAKVAKASKSKED